ncbi:subtype I-C CRISPR-associated endonuclease Cas1, partial [Corallococcus sp. CA049B]
MSLQLNTLFVTTDGAYLRKDHETVVVRVEEATRVQVPLQHLASVVCFGRVG